MKMQAIDIKQQFLAAGRVLRRYSVIVFIAFMVGIYGFLIWRIAALNQVAPDPSIVSAKVKTAGVPHIDADVLEKIQQLQDNSVEVQTLFDDARSNPFQE